MSLTGLSCDTIGDLDGGTARAIIDAEISRAVGDLDDRGGEDGKTRKVKIELSMIKDRGLIAVSVAAKAELPPYQAGLTQGMVEEKATKRGVQKTMLFQDLNPDNPEQPTFPEMDQSENE